MKQGEGASAPHGRTEALGRARERRVFQRWAAWLGCVLAAFALSHPARAEEVASGRRGSTLPFAAGSASFCVVDATRGFDVTGGVQDGQRLLVVQAWYPIERSAAASPRVERTTIGDYFAGDRGLLRRTTAALLKGLSFDEAAIDAGVSRAAQKFDVPRGSYRDATIAVRQTPFPVVLYSHGTLQQRFSNDAMAEQLAMRGYIVLAPEHTGNDPLAPLGAFCGAELKQPGVVPASVAGGVNEYPGQTFDPFFLVGSPDPTTGTINPLEVSLTLDRVGDYRAVLRDARSRFNRGRPFPVGSVGLIGYSRGAMHGLVGAEVLPEVGASVSIVGGTPLRFYARDAEAAPINAALAAATHGHRRKLDRWRKPVLEIIGGEDVRRSLTTERAAKIGVYPAASAALPSPIVDAGFGTLHDDFGVLVQVSDLSHFDLVDDPIVEDIVVKPGERRPRAFDGSRDYMPRPALKRRLIRDHYVQAFLDLMLRDGQPCANVQRELQALFGTRFEAQGVSRRLGPSGRGPDALAYRDVLPESAARCLKDPHVASARD